MQWQPSREGYLRFLTESKVVYETLEGIVAEAHHPDCEHFFHAIVPLIHNSGSCLHNRRLSISATKYVIMDGMLF